MHDSPSRGVSAFVWVHRKETATRKKKPGFFKKPGFWIERIESGQIGRVCNPSYDPVN